MKLHNRDTQTTVEAIFSQRRQPDCKPAEKEGRMTLQKGFRVVEMGTRNRRLYAPNCGTKR